VTHGQFADLGQQIVDRRSCSQAELAENRDKRKFSPTTIWLPAALENDTITIYCLVFVDSKGDLPGISSQAFS
jgi:hypothetical protein